MLGRANAAYSIDDLSATGASLTFSYAPVLPGKFRLRFVEDGREETANVIWRRGSVVGVSFWRPLDFPAREARHDAQL